MPEAKAILGLTFQGANRLVRRLVGLGILKELTGQQRNRVFRCSEYANLFA